MVTKIKPYNPRASDLVADWHVIDASGEVLGRLATRVAWLLMGKHKPGYVRHLSSGDFVVVVNAGKVRTTGNKSQQIVYRRHSQYPGNLKEIPYQRVMETHPTRIIEHAVRGMLPKSKLGDRMYSRLKVYAEETHPHMAQVTGSQRRIERVAAAAVQEAEEAVKQPARRRRRRARAVAERRNRLQPKQRRPLKLRRMKHRPKRRRPNPQGDGAGPPSPRKMPLSRLWLKPRQLRPTRKMRPPQRHRGDPHDAGVAAGPGPQPTRRQSQPVERLPRLLPPRRLPRRLNPALTTPSRKGHQRSPQLTGQGESGDENAAEDRNKEAPGDA